nr:MAG: hypothetical protein [Bacteriophage sp.]
MEVGESKRVVEVEERERSKNWRRVEVREVWRGQKREEYGLEDFLGNGLHDSRLFWDFGMGTMRVVGGI